MHYHEDALQQVKHNTLWYTLLGFGLIILGAVAMYFAFFTTLISMVALGALLIAGGIVEAITAWKFTKWSTFLVHLLFGIVYLVCGLFIIFYPMINAVTLTLVLAAFFVVAGVSRIIVAFRRPLPHKTWIVFSGVLSVILGILLWLQWPASGLWVIGFFVGIDMIFAGATLLQLAIFSRTIQLEEQHREYR